VAGGVSGETVARRRAQGRIIRHISAEGLHAQVAVVSRGRRCLDGAVAEGRRPGIARNRGDAGVGVGTSDDEVELLLVGADIGRIRDRQRLAEEGALDQGGRGRRGCGRAVLRVGNLGATVDNQGVALEVDVERNAAGDGVALGGTLGRVVGRYLGRVCQVADGLPATLQVDEARDEGVVRGDVGIQRIVVRRLVKGRVC